MEYTTDPEQLDFESIDSTETRQTYLSYLDMQSAERNILGYRAQTVQDLIFKPHLDLGFDLGYHNLDLYKYTFDNVHYFDNDAPLTRLTYVLGFKEEQAFQVMHSQKIKQRFNINIDFQRLSSRGNLGVDNFRNPDLFRQGATSKNLFAELWYRSLNGKYNVAFAYLNNENEINEHGGLIESDRNFLRDSLNVDRNLLRTLYDQAKRGLGDKRFRFRQSIDFGSYYDYALNDSVNIQKLDPKLRVYHTSEYVDEYASYEDLNIFSGNYNNVLFNPRQTLDTLEAQRWIHRAGLNFLLGKNDFSKYTGQVKAGLKYESIYVQQESDYNDPFVAENDFTDDGWRRVGEYLNNSLLESRFDLRKKDLIGLDLRGTFNLGLAGINEGDLSYSASLGYQLEVGGLRVWNAYSNRRPSQIFYRHENNHSPYERTSLQNIEITSFGASLSFKQQPISISLENSTINNWLVFQSDGERKQEADAINLIHFNLRSNFRFGKWRWENNLHLQNASSSVLGIPQFTGQSAIHFISPLFENATIMDLGMTARFWSAYKTLKYEPHLGSFAINGTELNTYPIFDMFANFQINRVNVYVRTEHLSQNLLGNTYFPTPYISAPDRNVRFGFSWLFYD